MKKVLFTVFLINTFFVVFAEDTLINAPDYKTIKTIINDKKSESYYPKLMERYNNSDTSLSIENFRTLYYGFLFTDLYSPYPMSKFNDSISSILRKDTLFKNDYISLIKYENLILQDCPFNLRDLNMLAYSYSQIGDTLSANLNVFKLNMTIKTILSTGDGREEKSAWHVISVSHEYDILQVLGFEFGGKQMLTTNGCDYLEVQENEYNITGFYFDVQMILEKERESFKK
jgi:hypothetical protein